MSLFTQGAKIASVRPVLGQTAYLTGISGISLQQRLSPLENLWGDKSGGHIKKHLF
jgi:hypothetical protein